MQLVTSMVSTSGRCSVRGPPATDLSSSTTSTPSWTAPLSGPWCCCRCLAAGAQLFYCPFSCQNSLYSCIWFWLVYFANICIRGYICLVTSTRWQSAFTPGTKTTSWWLGLQGTTTTGILCRNSQEKTQSSSCLATTVSRIHSGGPNFSTLGVSWCLKIIYWNWLFRTVGNENK